MGPSAAFVADGHCGGGLLGSEARWPILHPRTIMTYLVVGNKSNNNNKHDKNRGQVGARLMRNVFLLVLARSSFCQIIMD